MTNERDTLEPKIRKMFRIAAINASMSVFFLAIGLNNAMNHAVLHSLHGSSHVIPEILLDIAYFLISAFSMGMAVYRFGKANIAIAGLHSPE